MGFIEIYKKGIQKQKAHGKSSMHGQNCITFKYLVNPVLLLDCSSYFLIFSYIWAMTHEALCMYCFIAKTP